MLAGYPGVADHHGPLLDDAVRCHAMVEAVRAVVGSGDVVCDLGAGSGLLSVAAARAGASSVYAVEHTPMAAVCARVCRDNGADSVTVLGVHSDDAVLPPLDAIVSECFGVFGLGSTMIDDVMRLRARCLKPDGQVLPRRVRTMGALVESPACHAFVERFDAPRHGLDLSALSDVLRSNFFQAVLEDDELASDAAPLLEVDLRHDVPEAERHGRAQLRVNRDAVVHGIGAWFEADLTDTHPFATGPADPRTGWHQVFFPLTPREVRAGDEVVLELGLRRDAQHLFEVLWGWRHRDLEEHRSTRGSDPRTHDPSADTPSAHDPSANHPSAHDPSAHDPSGRVAGPETHVTQSNSNTR